MNRFDKIEQAEEKRNNPEDRDVKEQKLEDDFPDDVVEDESDGEFPDDVVEDESDGEFPDDVVEDESDGEIPDDIVEDESDGEFPDDVVEDEEDDDLTAMEKSDDSRVSGCPIEGHNGSWDGSRGNSMWRPDRVAVPTRYNPDGRTWGQILDKHGIKGIEYKDGNPDFSPVSKGEVEIDDFSDDRTSNFTQADEELAKQKGCNPKDVKKWRDENGYTWHECRDCKTMQKVPREVHNNMDHSGGVSEYKKAHNNEGGAE